MNNKKSQISGEVLWMIPQILFLVAVIFAFVILVKVLIVTEIDIREFEANILIDRLLFSKDGISYYDEEIDRLYPGIIDLGKFYEIMASNQEEVPSVLDEKIINYGPDNPIIAAKITLEPDLFAGVTITTPTTLLGPTTTTTIPSQTCEEICAAAGKFGVCYEDETFCTDFPSCSESTCGCVYDCVLKGYDIASDCRDKFCFCAKECFCEPQDCSDCDLQKCTSSGYGNEVESEDSEELAIYYNQDRFNKWEPRAILGVTGGAGSYMAFEKRMHVLATDGESLTPAFLVFYVLI